MIEAASLRHFGRMKSFGGFESRGGNLDPWDLEESESATSFDRVFMESKIGRQPGIESLMGIRS